MTFPYISEQNSELLISKRHSWSETAYRMVFENLKYVFPTQHYSTAPSPLSVYCDNHRRVINSSARQSSAPTPKAAEDCHADELIPTGHIWQFLDQLLVKSPGCFLYLVLAEYMVFWNIKEKRDLKLMIQLQYLSRSCIHSTLTAPTISKSTCIGEPYISKVWLFYFKSTEVPWIRIFH